MVGADSTAVGKSYRGLQQGERDTDFPASHSVPDPGQDDIVDGFDNATVQLPD
jgi:hypothetical protein